MHKLYLLLSVILLSGCVTTTTGDIPRASSDEAASLNLDLGLGYLRQGDYELAQSKLEKSIREKSDNPTAHRALGFVFEQLGEFDEAEKEYRLAVKQAPDDPDVLDQLAVFLCIRGEPDEALEIFEDAVTKPMNQQRYVIYTNAGTCAKRENKLELSEDYLRKALVYNPKYPTALLQIADVAYRRENYLQSRAFIERFLAVSGPSPSVLWLAYRVEDALQAYAAAEEIGQQLLGQFPESREAGLLLERQRNAG